MFSKLSALRDLLNSSEEYVQAHGLVKEIKQQNNYIDIHPSTTFFQNLKSEIEEHILFDSGKMDASEICKNILINVSENRRFKKKDSASFPPLNDHYDVHHFKIVCKECENVTFYDSKSFEKNFFCNQCGTVPSQNIFFGDELAHRVDEPSTYSNEVYSFKNQNDFLFEQSVLEQVRKIASGKIFLNDEQEREVVDLLKSKPKKTKRIDDANEIVAVLMIVLTDFRKTKSVQLNKQLANFSCKVCGKKHSDRKSSLFCCRGVQSSSSVQHAGVSISLVPLKKRKL